MVKLHDFLWISFILESFCINAEKIFELAEALVKFSEPNSEERAENMKDYAKWKAEMSTYHGCMKANLMKLEQWETEVQARENGWKQMEHVKSLYTEFTAFFNSMKTELMNPGRHRFLVFVCFCIGEGGVPPYIHIYNVIHMQ